MDDERPLTPFTTDQLAHIYEYERRKREQREQKARGELERDDDFRIMLATRGIDDKHLRQLALEAAAKEIGREPRRNEERARLADFAVSKAFEQEALEIKQALEKDLEQQRLQARQQPAPQLQSERPAIEPAPARPDYFARNESRIDRIAPKAQWLGKYQKLDDLSRGDEGVLRRQQEESAKRQQPAIETAAKAERVQKGDHALAPGEKHLEAEQRLERLMNSVTHTAREMGSRRPGGGQKR